jgi:hypothetical protein
VLNAAGDREAALGARLEAQLARLSPQRRQALLEHGAASAEASADDAELDAELFDARHRYLPDDFAAIRARSGLHGELWTAFRTLYEARPVWRRPDGAEADAAWRRECLLSCALCFPV